MLGDAATSNATINARIQRGNSAHVVDWLQAATTLYAFKIAAKLLQIET